MADPSEADRTFLAAAAEDIQRRLRGIAVVESIGTGAGDSRLVEVVVVVRAGRRRLEYRGRGEGLTDAYRALLVAAMHGPHAGQPSADAGAVPPSRSTAPPGAAPVDLPADGPDEDDGMARGNRVPAPV